VTAGDLTGDGRPELFFSDYDDGGSMIFDYNDRLLINDGTGVFTDQTTIRLTQSVMYMSDFGIANAIADMNGDGLLDIVRLTAQSAPYHIGIAYNDPLNPGFFTDYEQVYNLSGYHMAVGDLNDDGLMDVIAIDDGTDRYLLNQGPDPQGLADFQTFVFPPQTGILHAGNVIVEDLDQDGWNDVIIADVDITFVGCNDRMFILHNQGDGPNVSFVEEDQVIPDAGIGGVHDVAIFDIDGNGWKDLVIGRCCGTQIWMNTPPLAVAFAYPGGLPEFIEPDVATPLPVQLQPVGDVIEPGSPQIHISINDGPFSAQPMADLGGDLYEGSLPASACGDEVSFYVSAELSGGQGFSDPPGAPSTAYVTIASSPQLVVDEAFEADVSDWSVVDDPSLTAGSWEQAVPNPTFFGNALLAPAADATPDGTQAFVTANGPPGANASTYDVDGGPTSLISPRLDLGGGDAVVSYSRWAETATGTADTLTIEVSDDDGVSWTLVETVTHTGNAWQDASFRVGDFVTPTSQVRVRFSVCDCPNDSLTEAGIDDFRVTVLCPAADCPADLDGNGVVETPDFLTLLAAWGPNPGHPADLDGNGIVETPDFLALLAAWGDCG
jgi:hypothetical protein